MSRSTAVRLLVLGILGTTLILSLIFLPELREAFGDFLIQVQDLGWIGYGLFALLYAVGAVFLIPGSLLTLGAGAVFGFWGGYVAVTVGSLLGAGAAFLIGRRLVRGLVEQKT